MSHIIDQYDVGTTFDPSIPKDIARAAIEILKAPEKWKNIPLIKVGNPELRARLGTNQKRVPFNTLENYKFQRNEKT